MTEPPTRGELIATLRIVRNYLDAHNSREALEGYLNDIAEEINPTLLALHIQPIEVIPDDED